MGSGVMTWILRLAALLTSLVAAAAANAQSPAPTPDVALLVADQVFLEGQDRLVAEGNVQAMQDGVTLWARRISYDRATDTLALQGPLRLQDGDDMIIVADAAELSNGMKDGILRGARLVLDQQFQLAAQQLNRVGGRYSQLSQVAATSCQVCGRNQVPLWQIRARRAIHDADARQIYFENAQLRILDVPVFFLPRLRIPDPTLERAQGFLIPRTRSTSLLGLGVKIPYFLPLGDHADLTLTPYLSPVTRTLELRYRRAYRTGRIEFNGAISDDTLTTDPSRHYLFGSGNFDLGRGYQLNFDIETVSDRGYLAEYGYSDKDRLDSAIEITRTSRDRFFNARVINYQTLRDGESNSEIPALVGDLTFERRIFPRGVGGEVRLGLTAHAHERYSNRDGIGRDVTRASGRLLWQNRWTMPGGIRAALSGQLDYDIFDTRQDSGHVSRASQLSPGAKVELRWPWTMTDRLGGAQLLEPVVQIGWTGGDRLNVANDESSRVELDEGNLLSLSRFPAADRRERGVTAAYGVRWARYDPSGWAAHLTLGQVVRETTDPDLSRSSGLKGSTSDLLISGQLKMASGLAFTARGLLDGSARFSKAEARAAWSSDRLNLGASYLLLVQDPAENRPTAISEWSFDGSYKVTRHVTFSANSRYDLVRDDFARAGIGLNYRNECIDMNFTATRRFSSNSNTRPSTDYGLTVALKGFSTGGSAKNYRRTCRNGHR